VPTVGALGVLGKGDIWSARLTWQTTFTAQSTQSLFIGADYKHFLQSIAVDSETSLNTPITYTNFTIGYSGDWRLATRQWSFNTSANFGVRGLVNDPDSFENKRYLARPNYFYLREDGSFTQTLPAGFRLRLRVAGQFTDEPLISNENYAISGADGVRGYLESEELGDQAIKGTVQFYSPTWIAKSFNGQWFAFYDTGRIEILDPLQGEADHAILKSLGSGFSFSVSSSYEAALTWAFPLVNSTATRAHDSVVLFSVRGAF
jgi:hemolysin activation/secretion protein